MVRHYIFSVITEIFFKGLSLHVPILILKGPFFRHFMHYLYVYFQTFKDELYIVTSKKICNAVLPADYGCTLFTSSSA